MTARTYRAASLLLAYKQMAQAGARALEETFDGAIDTVQDAELKASSKADYQPTQKDLYAGLTSDDAKNFASSKHGTLKPRTKGQHSSCYSIFIRYAILLKLVQPDWDGDAPALVTCCRFWELLIAEHKLAIKAGQEGPRAGQSAIYMQRLLVRSA